METGTHIQTRTHARYVAAKIAADLKRLQRLAQQNIPSDQKISDFQEEAEALLLDGYLSEVTYGFRRGDEWIMALRYVVATPCSISGQDPGSIDVNEDGTGARFSSFLIYSDKWNHLSEDERRLYKSMLPLQRSSGEEPNGDWSDYDNSYKSGDIGVQRRRLIS